ncbi:phytase [Chitinophaga ginsengisoli]|uniref:3-phytase n=1 Tax=Chitinophaga ginsengisoli TaxID=363837 RepID=A0A2P8GPD5_9BACT|nr:phytase [Chitinophaga ginsengisoli]PSL35814.1 3-phytase [Chitinophaga ginsengisoli]
MLKNILAPLSGLVLFGACQVNLAKTAVRQDGIKPVIVTQETGHDTDDPAIWINKADTLKSLIIGTDKNSEGGLYAFDLEGKIVNKVMGLKRPNNVDIAYGFKLNGQSVDIAVLTERETNSIRVFRLPDLTPLDNGGIPVFLGEKEQSLMGIALYTRRRDAAIFAIVGRKSGPADGYLWQYRLVDEGGVVKGRLVRKFGAYSGKKEIESIAVDNQLGYIYYSDETVGVRKYVADPSKWNNIELALFAKDGFASDHEGISIYPSTDTTGYILVSNQQNNSFMVYRREGENGHANEHKLIAEVPVSTLESDGSDVTAVPLGNKFSKGLFVAMSNGKVFHYYSWEDIAGKIEKK